MLLKIFAVQDLKAQGFLQPFFYVTVGQAVRAVSDLVNDGKSDFARHTPDYVLFQVGTFNVETGVIAGELTPVGPLVNFKTGGEA